MEVMGLMLGEFVDDYTVRVVDVFAMPQSGTGVSVEAVDHAFQTNMLDMLKQTGRYAAYSDTNNLVAIPLLIIVVCLYVVNCGHQNFSQCFRAQLVMVCSVLHPCQVKLFLDLVRFKSYRFLNVHNHEAYAILMSAKCSHPSCCE
jgi:hypothetical protein